MDTYSQRLLKCVEKMKPKPQRSLKCVEKMKTKLQRPLKCVEKMKSKSQRPLKCVEKMKSRPQRSLKSVEKIKSKLQRTLKGVEVLITFYCIMSVVIVFAKIGQRFVVADYYVFQHILQLFFKSICELMKNSLSLRHIIY